MNKEAKRISDIIHPLRVEGNGSIVPAIRIDTLATFLGVSIRDIRELFDSHPFWFGKDVLCEHEARRVITSIMCGYSQEREGILEELKETCLALYTRGNKTLLRELKAIDNSHIYLTKELLGVKDILFYLTLQSGENSIFEAFQIYLLGKMRGKQEERKKRKKIAPSL